jgi:hypothetical protein
VPGVVLMALTFGTLLSSQGTDAHRSGPFGSLAGQLSQSSGALSWLSNPALRPVLQRQDARSTTTGTAMPGGSVSGRSLGPCCGTGVASVPPSGAPGARDEVTSPRARSQICCGAAAPALGRGAVLSPPPALGRGAVRRSRTGTAPERVRLFPSWLFPGCAPARASPRSGAGRPRTGIRGSGSEHRPPSTAAGARTMSGRSRRRTCCVRPARRRPWPSCPGAGPRSDRAASPRGAPRLRRPRPARC